MDLKPCLPVALFMLVACGPTRMSTGPTVPTVVQIANEREHSYVVMTDLETVNDVYDTATRVWVATNLGLYEYATTGGVGKKANWLPETAIQTVAETQDGTIWAGVGAEVWSRSPNQEIEQVSLGTDVRDLATGPEGTTYACTRGGLWRSSAGSWQRSALGLQSCNTLLSVRAALWIIADEGRALVELSNSIARAHHHAIAELVPDAKARIIAIAPLQNGEALALLHSQEGALLALLRDGVWISYTSLPFDGVVLGLSAGSRPHEAWLATTGGHFLIDVAEEAEGVGAVPVSVGRHERIVSWKPNWVTTALAADAVSRPESAELSEEEASARSVRFADAPTESPEAPAVRFRLLELPNPGSSSEVFSTRRGVFVAAPHRGVTRLSAANGAQHYATRSLLPAEGVDYRLSLADGARGPMLRTAGGHIAAFEAGRLRPVAHEKGFVIQSLASHGSKLIGAGPSPTSETAIAIYEHDGGAFKPTRTVEIGAKIATAHRLGLSAEGDVWAALQVHREDGSVSPRGVVWLPADGRDPAVFHSGIEVVEGALSKPAPDNVFDLDLGQGGFAWLATFSGAVRIGDDQVIVFGQARGIPGESVFDIRASDERMWIVAAGGLGTYDNRDLDFRTPETARSTRATRVATYADQVWVAGPSGIARNDGKAWHKVELSGPIVDLDIDRSGRVWLLFGDQLVLIEPTGQ